MAARGVGGAGALVRREDGLAALVHRLPPPERRGVVLIDPSYEIKSDYEAVVAALAQAHRRFATGVFLLWYPVIERDRDRSDAGGAGGHRHPAAAPARAVPAAGRGWPRHDRSRHGRGQPALDAARRRLDAACPGWPAPSGRAGQSAVEWLLPPKE